VLCCKPVDKILKAEYPYRMMLEIQTQHLHLKALTVADLPAMVELWSEPLVMRYLPTGEPRSPQATQAEVVFMLDHWQQHGLGLFAVRRKGEVQFLGYCGLQHLHVEPDGVSAEQLAQWPDEVEIEYGLAPSAWGQGIASEAALACLQFGFDIVELPRIVAATHPDNIASERILTEKLGLRPAPEMNFYGELTPHFALQRSDYQSPDVPLFWLSDDPAHLDLEAIRAFLAQAYWAKDRPFEVIQRSIQNSLNIGIYERHRQVAFTRIITDYATFAWVCDVFVDENWRGHGLGKWLVDATVRNPRLQGLRRLLLATRDAHELYRQFGFTELPVPERWMERFSG
jgi:RimJ/RimL family protein N-acetyltransferase/N-acetylglutamate synthase-like GNAT family acetyltransferase